MLTGLKVQMEKNIMITFPCGSRPFLILVSILGLNVGAFPSHRCSPFAMNSLLSAGNEMLLIANHRWITDKPRASKLETSHAGAQVRTC